MALWSVASPPTPQKLLLTVTEVTASRSIPSATLLKLTISSHCVKQRRPVLCCSGSETISSSSSSSSPPVITTASPPVLEKRRNRYRKKYPGEDEGITEEMRFVAMGLRNAKIKRKRVKLDFGYEDASSEKSEKEEEEEETESELSSDGDGDEKEEEDKSSEKSEKEEEEEEEETRSELASDGDGDEEEDGGVTWTPKMEGFVKHLVDSKLVFDTIEGIVDESTDVSFTYFRNTGLERSEALSRDLEWLRQQDTAIPEPSKPGVSYSNYLKEIAEKRPPMFLCHFYNIYFSHIAGGQVIARQASEKILDGRKLEFCQWEGDVQELLRIVRVNLNNLGEQWTRKEKQRALREVKRSFQFLAEIVRLIVKGNW